MCYMQDNYHCNLCIIYVRRVETVTHFALKINFELVVLVQTQLMFSHLHFVAIAF